MVLIFTGIMGIYGIALTTEGILSKKSDELIIGNIWMVGSCLMGLLGTLLI